MRTNPQFAPNFKLTDQQNNFLNSNTYRDASEQDRLATIAARLLSNDPSAGTPTSEQLKFVNSLKQRMIEESGVLPKFAKGGEAEKPMSPELIKALLLAYDSMPEMQQPVAQPIPKTAVGTTRDKIAQVIGEKAADRLFGTGTEGQQTEYQALQLVNPLFLGAQAADLYKQSGQELKEGSYGSAAGSAALAGLNVLPFAGPVGRAGQKIIKKIK